MVKRILAITLVFCMLFSSVAFAFDNNGGSHGSGDQGSSGASYNEGTGSADITTGTSSGGADKIATRDRWAITEVNDTFTSTLYRLSVNGKSDDVGEFYDVDWTKGTRGYKNSKTDIDSFVKKASQSTKINMSEEEIRAAGFEIHIYAKINARRPYGDYNLYTIKGQLPMLTSKNGDGTGGDTFIARVVRNAANNLGDPDENGVGQGWAYYTVPAEITEDLPTLIKTFVTVVGVDSKGQFILEEFKPAEKEVISLDDPRFDKNTGILQLTPIESIENGVAYINDIITSPKDLTKAEDVDKVKWLTGTPVNNIEKINANSTDLSRFYFGIISGETVEIEVISEEPSNNSGDFNYTIQNKRGMLAGIDKYIKGASTNVFGTYDPYMVDMVSMAAPKAPSGVVSAGHKDPRNGGIRPENKMLVIDQTHVQMSALQDEVRMIKEAAKLAIPTTGGTVTQPPTKPPTTKPVVKKDTTGTNPYTEGDLIFIEPMPVINEINLESEVPYAATTLSEETLKYRLAVALEKWSEIPMDKASDIIIEVEKELSEEDKLKIHSMYSEVAQGTFTITEVLNTLEKNKADGINISVEDINQVETDIVELDKKIVELESYKDVASADSKTELEILMGNFGRAVDLLALLTGRTSEDIIEEFNNRSLPIAEPEVNITENNKKAGISLITNGAYNVAYLRYIVLPTSTQINVVDLKANGVSTGNHIVFTSELTINTVGGKDYTQMFDIRTDGYPSASFNSWYTDDAFELDPTIIPTVGPNNYYPNDGSYDMTAIQNIEDMPLGENIYAFWEMDVVMPPQPSGDVPEWRLSQYEDKFIENGNMLMSMSLRRWGNYRNSLSPSHNYQGNYKTFNPNNLETENSYNPTNMNLTPIVNAPWYHSKITEAYSNNNIGLLNLASSVVFDANLNRVKAGALGNYRVANWVTSNNPLVGDLNLHGITSGQTGVPYVGAAQETKVSNFIYRLENESTYTHYYTDRERKYDRDGNPDGYRYTRGDYDLSPSYISFRADNVTTVFDRYIPSNTDGRMLNNVASVKNEQNGKTTIAMQESYIMNLFPEVAMLFENDRGDRSIAFVAGDTGRKIKPISFHSLEHKVYVEAKSIGTSPATTMQAKQTANAAGVGNNQVIHKGAGVNTTFDIKDRSGSSSRGYLEVKSYVLDIATSSLKTAWGNAFNTNTVKNNFLGQWSFSGKGSSKLEVTVPGGAALAYDGPLKVNNINYTKGSESVAQHRLTVRGGILTHVNGTPIATVQASNPALYEALVGMRLVGPNKNATVLATFERQQGKLLTEDAFRTMAASSRNNISSDLVLNQGWYNEDSTQLVVTEFTTRYNVPNSMYADKLPMTVKGLETPVNKAQYYTKMSLGYVFLNYTLESNPIPNLGTVKTYFETTTRTNSPFNTRAVNYGVPNVSISDTTGLF